MVASSWCVLFPFLTSVGKKTFSMALLVVMVGAEMLHAEDIWIYLSSVMTSVCLSAGEREGLADSCCDKRGGRWRESLGCLPEAEGDGAACKAHSRRHHSPGSPVSHQWAANPGGCRNDTRSCALFRQMRVGNYNSVLHDLPALQRWKHLWENLIFWTDTRSCAASFQLTLSWGWT